MNNYQKEQQMRLIVSALIGVCMLLVLIAMFTTIEHRAEITGMTTGYTVLPDTLDITVSTGIRLMLLGVFSGIIGGMMGMGGGIIKASGLMIIFGLEMLLVRSIALITNVFIYGSAAYRYTKTNGLVIKKVAEIMIPGALIGVALGFLFGLLMNSIWLQRLLGIFALYAGLDMMRRLYLSRAAGSEPPQEYSQQQFNDENKIKMAGAGLPMGMVMGLFGISGGVIGVPYQRFILKIPMKSAIANTSVTSLVASAVALIFALWYEYAYGQHGITTPLIMALWIIPGNVVGAQIGAFLTGILPIRFIKLMYVTIMLLIALRLLV